MWPLWLTHVHTDGCSNSGGDIPHYTQRHQRESLWCLMSHTPQAAPCRCSTHQQLKPDVNNASIIALVSCNSSLSASHPSVCTCMYQPCSSTPPPLPQRQHSTGHSHRETHARFHLPPPSRTAIPASPSTQRARHSATNWSSRVVAFSFFLSAPADAICRCR